MNFKILTANCFIYSSLFFLSSCTSDIDNNLLYDIAYDEVYYETIFSRFPEDNDTLYTERIIVHNPYNNSGTLRLKGPMHNHTSNSLGIDDYSSGEPKWTLEKYRDEGGFDFINITDHNFATPDPGVKDIIWMGTGLEDTDLKSTGHHIVVYNLPDGYKYHKISDDINEQVDYYHSLGALVSYAHPDWKNQYQSNEKILNLKKIDFVEVLICEDQGSIRAYNTMLLKGPVGAFATDDFHYNPERYEANKYFNKSYIVVYGHKKKRESIWNDIIHGRYYATSGAGMEITYHNGVIDVYTDTPSTIEFHGVDPSNPCDEFILKTSKSTQNSSYKMDASQKIIWIRIINKSGKAISQAFHIKKL